MTLTPGTRLGVYDITAQIGEGGMGQVYRATDTNLKRSVAIKVLPASVAGDADRLARFQREAEVLAALNHPNIAAIYGLEKTPNVTALVMELVEGEDLSQRIARGAIPIDEALTIAKQIAEALEAAHEQGIIHRDLKPANIKVRGDGTVKVLDFGLAKATESAAGSPTSVSMLPTITTPAMTQAGMILGTAAYMSPEQARGKTVDKRADIWAFGVVLYEMLVGKRLFAGDSVPETLGLIFSREPDLATLPDATPARVRTLIARCLAKDPRQRLRDIGDARLDLDVSTSPAVVVPASPRGWRMPAFAAVLVAVAIGSAAYVLGKRAGTAPPPSYQRLTFSRGTIWNARFTPDGQTVVYSARWNGNPLDVFSVRAGKTESRSLKLADTDVMAISPSNELAVLRNRQYIGNFISRGTLARMPVDGGAARDLLDDVQEADWSPDGTALAVVRWVDGQNQLEYPAGTVLYKSAGHLNHPRISPNGDRVAFMDHPTQLNTRGWVVVVDLTGKKMMQSGEWSSEEGLAWAPAGDEVWFTANKSGEAEALYAVTLAGRERLILQPIAHLESADNIIGWSSDGRTLFIYRSQDMPLTFRVSRFDPATGRKELVREITPADPVGILADNFNNFVFMTPDGRGYAYSVSRILSDLHLIEGLK